MYCMISHGIQAAPDGSEPSFLPWQRPGPSFLMEKLLECCGWWLYSVLLCYSTRSNWIKRFTLMLQELMWVDVILASLSLMCTDKRTNCTLLGSVDCDSFYKWIPLNRWPVAISSEVLHFIYWASLSRSLPLSVMCVHPILRCLLAVRELVVKVRQKPSFVVWLLKKRVSFAVNL